MRIKKKKNKKETFQQPILVFTSHGRAVPFSIRTVSIVAVVQLGKHANVMFENVWSCLKISILSDMYLVVSRCLNHQTSSINAVISIISAIFRQFFLPLSMYSYVCMEGYMSAVLSVVCCSLCFQNRYA